jgi:hypothetical protein
MRKIEAGANSQDYTPPESNGHRAMGRDDVDSPDNTGRRDEGGKSGGQQPNLMLAGVKTSTALNKNARVAAAPDNPDRRINR